MNKPDGFASTYIPPWALTCWTDETHVYTAVPSRSGPPLIQRYPLTEGGLSKALAFLKAQPRTQHASAKYIPPALAAFKRRPLASKDQFTEDQHARAKAILRKIGFI